MSMQASTTTNRRELLRGIARWLIKVTIMLALYALGMFLAAGRLDWPAGWRFFGLMVLIQGLNFAALLWLRPDLLVERSQMREGTEQWDVFLSVATALLGPLAVAVTGGLDTRWNLSQVAPALQMVGFVLGLLGGAVGLWAMLANRFFAATVRIQHDRGHEVVSEGPYRIVRHPGYLGGVLFNLAAPLVLGAWWALIPAVLTVAAILARTSLEDRTLQAKLPGYRAYAAQTLSRLLPGIW